MTNTQSEPAYYIFIASNLPTFDQEIPAPEVIKELLDRGYWLIGGHTRNRKAIKEGDKAVFYAAGKGNRVFLAMATIASACTPLRDRGKLAIEVEFVEALGFEHPGLLSFKVTNIAFFDTHVPASQLVDHFSFIKNRRRWGIYFQGGSMRISKEDFELVIKEGFTNTWTSNS